MSEGESDNGVVDQVSKDLVDIFPSLEKEILLSSSEEYMELPRNPILIPGSSFSIF